MVPNTPPSPERHHAPYVHLFTTNRLPISSMNER